MDPDAHRREVEAWREGRYAALRRDLGWLTLAGLDWLRPGSNPVRIGPDVIGTIDVGADGVTATGGWAHDGGPVERLPLVDDASGEPTVLAVGALRQCVIRRGGRLALRTWDLDSPLRRSFSGIDHWPVSLAWRLEARFEPTPGRSVQVPDVLGIVEEQASPGEVVIGVDGAEHRLQALSGGDGGELWLVFGDATNGEETYRGGRFLYTDAPAENGSVVVDFNRAYNPPCVFSPYATCPLPWPANRLPFRVEAGERNLHQP